jgi:hypothetical protein
MKLRNLGSISIVCAMSLTAQAQSLNAKIQNLNSVNSKVLILSPNLDKVKAGDLLTLDQNCSFEVEKLSKNRAILTTDFCDTKQNLKKNQMLSLQTSKNQSQPEATLEAPAANTSRVNVYQPRMKSTSSKGIRVGLIKSFLNGSVTVKDNYGNSYSGGGEVKNDYSVSLGYANIPVNEVGFLGNIYHMKYGQQTEGVRLDASATYGLNENIYFLGGANLHNFTRGITYMNPALGVQLGCGFQANKNLGFGLNIVTLNSKGTSDSVDVDYKSSGVELSVNGTF